MKNSFTKRVDTILLTAVMLSTSLFGHSSGGDSNGGDRDRLSSRKGLRKSNSYLLGVRNNNHLPVSSII